MLARINSDTACRTNPNLLSVAPIAMISPVAMAVPFMSMLVCGWGQTISCNVINEVDR